MHKASDLMAKKSKTRERGRHKEAGPSPPTGAHSSPPPAEHGSPLPRLKPRPHNYFLNPIGMVLSPHSGLITKEYNINNEKIQFKVYN